MPSRSPPKRPAAGPHESTYEAHAERRPPVSPDALPRPARETLPPLGRDEERFDTGSGLRSPPSFRRVAALRLGNAREVAAGERAVSRALARGGGGGHEDFSKPSE